MNKFKNFLTLFFATGFGFGYLPIAPATWGSAAMAFVCFWLVELPIGWYLSLAGALFIIGILTIPHADQYFRVKTGKQWDNRPVVIDECLSPSFMKCGK